MKRLPCFHRLCWFLLIGLLWAGPLAGCGSRAEMYAHQTMTAMADAANGQIITATHTTEALSAASVTAPAQEALAGAPVSGQELPPTTTAWVWINAATNTPAVLTLPDYPTFTVTPSPTVSLTPGRGPSPTRTRAPSITPTVTATANPPSALLRIDTPGEGSKIISPYDFQAAVARGEDDRVYLYLIGEDNQEFFSEVLDYRQSSFYRLLINRTLTFSFPGVAENARLILQTLDEQGRIMALSSVDVVLLSIGSNQINPAQHAYAPFLIDAPKEGTELTGGRLIVSGRAAPLNNNPVIIELLDEDGEVLAQKEMLLDAPANDEPYTPFLTELEVRVTRQVNARLVIRQESANRIPGTIALTSVAVLLKP